MDVTYLTAVAAGLLSFASPCVLPLVPAYLSFMTGVSVDGMRKATDDTIGWRAGLHSLAFVVGFSTVFISLGASATFLGQFMLSNMLILSKVGGLLIIAFGLHYMGLFRVGFLNLEARFNIQRKPPGLVGAYLIGLAFAFGWTPCIGPILATILAVAGGQGSISEGIALLAAYSAGLGIPFILAGLAINHFFAFFTRIRAHMHKIEIASGLLLVVVGVMIFMGDFNRIATWIIELFPGLATLG